MMPRLSRIALLAAPIVLAAATAPPNGGTVSIVPTAGEADPQTAAAEIVDGVGEALGTRGFTLLSDAGHSAYVAQVSLTRADVGTASVKVPRERASAAPGLTGAAGGGVTMPLAGGKRQAVALERFELDLLIRRRTSGEMVWHGAAVTVRALDGRITARSVAAELGEAMLRFYPGEPRGTVSVP